MAGQAFADPNCTHRVQERATTDSYVSTSLTRRPEQTTSSRSPADQSATTERTLSATTVNWSLPPELLLSRHQLE